MQRFQSLILSLTIPALLILVSAGCGDDKSPTGSGYSLLFTVSSDSDSKTVDLSDLETVTIENESAVKISDLVDTLIYTEPYNYAYRLVGSDGFYANVKGSPDNTYDHIQSGYIVLSTMSATFDESLELISRYNIKDTAELKILRKIDFITPADSLIQNVIGDLEAIAFEESLDAVPLIALIPEDFLIESVALSYELTAANDYAVTITYEELQEGYYIIDEDKVRYTNPDIPGSKKVSMLNRIAAVSP